MVIIIYEYFIFDFFFVKERFRVERFNQCNVINGNCGLIAKAHAVFKNNVNCAKKNIDVSIDELL